MKSRVMVIGDTHGEWGPLNKLIARQRPSLILQCGDFGWWPSFDGKNLDGSGSWNCKGVKTPIPLYWCDGNHEDHESLDSMGCRQKDDVWCYENVIHKPRGTVLKVDDQVVLFCGGGLSVDKHMRTPGFDWFYQEIPNRNDLDRMLAHDHVDIVISHTCPTEWSPRSSLGKGEDATRLMLSLVLEKYKPRLWYHGHYHKEAEGVSGDTKWYSLNHISSRGRFWRWME